MRPILFELGGVPLYGYGVMQIFAALAFVGLVALGKQRFGATGDALARTGLAAVVGGAVGSKVLFVLVNLDAKVPLSSLLTSGGFVATGGIIGAAIALAIVAFLWPVGAALDTLFFATVGFWLVSNVGCLLAGCCVGSPTERPWGLHFPAADERTHLFGLRRHPVPLYSMAIELVTLGAMLAFRPRGGGERALVGIVMLLVWRAIAEGTVADPTRPVMAMVMVGLAVLAALANVVLRLRRPATAR